MEWRQRQQLPTQFRSELYCGSQATRTVHVQACVISLLKATLSPSQNIAIYNGIRLILVQYIFLDCPRMCLIPLVAIFWYRGSNSIYCPWTASCNTFFKLSIIINLFFITFYTSYYLVVPFG